MSGDLQDTDGVDIGNFKNKNYVKKNLIHFFKVENLNLDIYVLIHKAMQHLSVYQLINLLKHFN